MSKKIHFTSSGKRKMAVAHATLTEGTGRVRVNSLLLEHYQPPLSRQKIMEPIKLAGGLKEVDIRVTVRGGGQASQADAVRLAIGRALAEYDEKLEDVFLDYDRTLLVADVRRKEAGKPNRHGKARSKTQKSYR